MEFIMIYKYTFSGEVRESGKKITSYVSAPMGVSQEEFYDRLNGFMKAFENVRATLN